MKQEVIDRLKHLPEKSRKALTEFSDKMSEAFGDNLYSLILFGSAAGANFIEGRSDINTLIILHKVQVPDLKIIMEAGKKSAKAGLAVPLVFEKGHVATSLDTFPLEFSDMKQRHVLICGEDPFEDASIEKKNLRYQCEREIKSILVNLRRGFLRMGGKKGDLENLLSDSLSSVLAACRGLLWIAGKTPPDDVGELLSAVKSLYQCQVSAIDRVWRLRRGQSGATAMLEALFDDYCRNIAEMAKVVDQI